MRSLRGAFAALALVVLLGAFAGGGRPAQAAPTHGGDRWALLVGIDKYRGAVARTGGSVGDVTDLRQALLDNGWRPDHIRTLTDDAATAANIREGWKWLAARSTDTTFTIFHYSGHIKQMPGDKDGDGEALDEYLWPVDNGFLSDAELGANMRRLRGWSWVDISGCEAAGLNDGISARNRLFTGASQEHEKAYDSSEWKNSIFTGLLADRGMVQMKADANGDDRMSVQEAFKYAATHAPEFTKRQSAGPQHPYMAGGDGLEWFLDPPAPARAAEPGPGPGGGSGFPWDLLPRP